ncbi:DUF805 domain-containing protein [Roseiterribacter gracilis]|uniref:DUF805 domain-containing protein n=1 Tax=Roseiterribacter gracilis TaxID=2812848 RepID=A0A8S8XDI9_9PROT|nr:DUF805 domain-containing protein [Rhodospirillales bacterium TMPK1]
MLTIPQLWLSFQGRASRQDFWVRFVFLTLVLFIFGYLADGMLGAGGMLVALLQLALLWPTFAVGVKRYHDRGKPGRAIVYLMSLFLALSLVATFAAPPVQRAQDAGLQPPVLYATVLVFASFASIGLFVYLLVVLGARKGEPGPNRYGPDPREKPDVA